MTTLKTLKTSAVATLAALTLLGVPAPQAVAADNPFATATPPGGHMLLAEDQPAQAPMKCGAGMMQGGTMTPGAGMGQGMGPGAGMGPGKGCKMLRYDTNGDGKVSKAEFMKGHEALFEQMDTNKDGSVDEAEMRAHWATMHQQHMGKCGQGRTPQQAPGTPKAQ